MLKRLCGAALTLLICVTVLFAAEIKGKVKEVKKGVITVTVGDKDQEVAYGKDTKFVDAEGKEITKGKGKALKDMEVIITTDKVDGKDVAKEVKVKK